MLEPDDDGYFTPVASTTLASIFKVDSSKNAAVNSSLKYKPPQLTKPEETSQPEDANLSECVFLCSVVAYEWIQGIHKCKGKAGFAMLKIVKTGLCKIILYSPDKSTLSCTTITPQLEVTISPGAMISFYDDHKKYWVLCFNDKVIDRVAGLLKKENVVVKPHINQELKSDIYHVESHESIDETNNSIVTEEGTPASERNKASILNRIANVGHAILPSLPVSPIKKISSIDVRSSSDACDFTVKLNVLPDVNVLLSEDDVTKIQDSELTKSIAIQTINNNEYARTSVTSFPLVNNQIFSYINGYMVPMHMQVPVIDNVIGMDTSTEIEHVIHKLNQLKGVVKTMETKQLDLTRISELEQSIKEKNENIMHLQQLKKDLCDRINCLNEQVDKLKEDSETKKVTFPNQDEHTVLKRKIITLMNNTFYSLASNFDNDVNYTGNNIKVHHEHNPHYHQHHQEDEEDMTGATLVIGRLGQDFHEHPSCSNAEAGTYTQVKKG